jgi:hypothetical protein
LGFGLFAAVVAVTNLLFSAYHEAEYFRTPVPMNSLGFRDYTGMARDAETYFPRQALATATIILACVFIGAFLAVRLSRSFAIGIGVAYIVFFLSFVLYVIACAAAAKYLLEPASPPDGNALLTYSLAENMIAGVTLLVFTASLGASTSVLGGAV